MKYRAEIDGLRAVAVLPVMLFHAGLNSFSGGFVGVDVFFVISGYLITTILIADIEKDRFSLISFYERRARRILPALFAVMLFCLPFAWVWMLPDQMKNFSQSMVAVSLFISNFLFWNESGYFAAAAEEKPLLHTWSLAVEEQYYIAFPIFLFLMWRFGRLRVFWMIVGISVLSLLSSEWLLRKYPSANFYLAPSRTWELLVGSMTAFVVQKRGVVPNNFFALFGLGGIILAITVFEKTTPFPGIYALLPVVGTALIIMFSGPDTFTGRILSHKVLVGIGLISYSAYLWHQPLLAFARIRLDHPTPGLLVGLCVAALAMAYLSWQYVERPFRVKGEGAIKRRTILLLSAMGGMAFIVIGIWGHRSQGFAERLPADLRVHTNLSDPGSYPCPKDQLSCVIKAPESKPHMLLFGDSHANQIARALVDRFKNRYKITLVLGNSCFMGTDIQIHAYAEKPDICQGQNAYLDGLTGQNFDVVITAQYWPSEVYGVSSPEWLPRAVADRVMLKDISATQKIILGNNPENPKVCQAKNSLFGREKICGTFEFERRFEAAATPYETANIHFIHPYKFLKLEADAAGSATDFVKTYLDTHHLTKTGSLPVVDTIETILAQKQQP